MRRPFPLLLLLAVAFCGCFGTRPRQVAMPPTPPVILSSEQLLSPSADMSARIPVGWVSLDAAKLELADVFAVACDSAYTMSLVFTEIPIDGSLRGKISRDGVRGLVDASWDRHWRRSRGKGKRVGDVEEFAIGRRQFAAYTYTTDTSTTFTRVAVYHSPRSVYECALTQLTFTERQAPQLDTLAMIHQLVLGGVEWE